MSSLVYPREQYSRWTKKTFKKFRENPAKEDKQNVQDTPQLSSGVSALERFKKRF